MNKKEQLFKILNIEDNDYNNNPQLIKMLIEYKGEEAHNEIHSNLLKKLINKYFKLNRELERKINKITRLSETDQLTKIYNRLKFKKELEREIRRLRRYQINLSLIMFDIDHFKKVNDTYGHDAGDKVLKRITEIVSNAIRDTDIFARWGGEEFMVLTPNTMMSQAYDLAERIRKNIEQKIIEPGGQVTCSFGVAEFNKNDNYDTFIKRADNALYEGKETGRNKVVAHTYNQK